MNCPQTGRKLRQSLDVFEAGEWVCAVSAAEALSGISGGMYEPVGSKRTVTALILVKRPGHEFPGPVPKMKPTSFQETVGDFRVWQHGRNARQWGLR